MADIWLPNIFYTKDTIFSDLDPLNEYFEYNGYESKYFIRTIASTFVFISIYICLWIFFIFLRIYEKVFKR